MQELNAMKKLTLIKILVHNNYIIPLGDYYLWVLMFDISVELHKSAKINTCKKIKYCE